MTLRQARHFESVKVQIPDGAEWTVAVVDVPDMETGKPGALNFKWHVIELSTQLRWWDAVNVLARAVAEIPLYDDDGIGIALVDGPTIISTPITAAELDAMTPDQLAAFLREET
jgi:hypothetical protein